MTDTFEHVLDWHPPSEERQVANQPYRLFAQANVEEPKELDVVSHFRSRKWTRKLWLDQGREGACTGFALAHCLGTAYTPWVMQDRDAQVLYQWAKRFDTWAGEDYDGSSVQGACEGAKHYGLIRGYWWIETPEEFKAALHRYGAIDVGSWWMSGMQKVDSNGFVHATGSKEGGHSYTVAAQDLKKNTGRIDNSWGKRWGVNGSALIDLDELFDLIFRQNGECALLRKNKFRSSLLPSVLG